jgi:hypothetical protein
MTRDGLSDAWRALRERAPVNEYLESRLREAEDRARSYRGEQSSRLTPDPVRAALHEGCAHGLKDALDAIDAGGNPAPGRIAAKKQRDVANGPN